MLKALMALSLVAGFAVQASAMIEPATSQEKQQALSFLLDNAQGQVQTASATDNNSKLPDVLKQLAQGDTSSVIDYRCVVGTGKHADTLDCFVDRKTNPSDAKSDELITNFEFKIKNENGRVQILELANAPTVANVTQELNDM